MHWAQETRASAIGSTLELQVAICGRLAVPAIIFAWAEERGLPQEALLSSRQLHMRRMYVLYQDPGPASVEVSIFTAYLASQHTSCRISISGCTPPSASRCGHIPTMLHRATLIKSSTDRVVDLSVVKTMPMCAFLCQQQALIAQLRRSSVQGPIRCGPHCSSLLDIRPFFKNT